MQPIGSSSYLYFKLEESQKSVFILDSYTVTHKVMIEVTLFRRKSFVSIVEYCYLPFVFVRNTIFP